MRGGGTENEANWLAGPRCRRSVVLGTVARHAIDYGRGSQAAAAEGRDRDGPPRDHAWSEGGIRLARRFCQLTSASAIEVRVVRWRQDRSGVGQDHLPPHAEC